MAYCRVFASSRMLPLVRGGLKEGQKRGAEAEQKENKKGNTKSANKKVTKWAQKKIIPHSNRGGTVDGCSHTGNAK